VHHVIVSIYIYNNNCSQDKVLWVVTLLLAKIIFVLTKTLLYEG